MRQGAGVLNFPDGRIFTGEFSIDNMNNYGHLTYPDGRVYVGYLKSEVPEGFGSM